MFILKLDSSCPEVNALQTALKNAGFSPGLIDGDFGPGTEAAVAAFQASENLTIDGIAGPQTWNALALPSPPLAPPPAPPLIDVTAKITVSMVSRIFPGTPVRGIRDNLAIVSRELHAAKLGDKAMVLMALGTIRAETGSFRPIDEGMSIYNTSPDGEPFDLYDNRKNLGNRGAPDGSLFKGRGFVQLTGQANYTKYKSRTGIDLVSDPAKANDPTIAARLLALFLQDKEARIRDALAFGDLAEARKLVNGGSHGLAEFTAAFRTGERILPDS